MKITKYAHACVVLEDQGQKLIIDPGEFTPDIGPVDNVCAVVVTHSHGDHFKLEYMQSIIAANPNVVVFTTPDNAASWGGSHAKVVHAYEDQQVGPFSFRFFGEEHAEIHPSTPVPNNTGVWVNNFYYPGDSFVAPDRDVHVLAVPASAPWMKTGEAMDFINAIRPKICFPTHDAVLSDVGRASADAWLSKAAEAAHTEYKPLHPGDSFDF